MATTKATSGRAQTKSRSSAGTRAKPHSKAGSGRGRSNSRGGGASRSHASRHQNGVVETLKGAAGKAKGPAVVVGAAAAGVAGGLALKRRSRRTQVLGVPLPRSVGRPSLSGVDLQSMAKALGEASRQFGQTSKNVSKDIERVGDQAERIAKILD
jgi:hypothetical protein